MVFRIDLDQKYRESSSSKATNVQVNVFSHVGIVFLIIESDSAEKAIGIARSWAQKEGLENIRLSRITCISYGDVLRDAAKE